MPPAPQHYLSSELQLSAVLITELIGVYNQRHPLPLEERIQYFKYFHEVCTAELTSYQGWLLESIGDSVRACFAEPVNSLLAGVSIARNIAQAVALKKLPKTTRIRLMIHYGAVHFDQSETIGSAVSACAELLPLVPAGNIWITEALFQKVKHFQSVQFQPLQHITSSNPMLHSISLFRVIVSDIESEIESLEDNDSGVTLTIIPLFHLGDSAFKFWWDKTLDDLLVSCRAISRSEADETINIKLKTFPDAVKLAANMIQDLGKPQQPPIDANIIPAVFIIECEPEYISHDCGAALPFFGNQYLEPGKINVLIKGESQHYHRLTPHNTAVNKQELLFPYRKVLVRGTHRSCFYCMDRRHPSSACPSKQLTHASYNSLIQLARLTTEELNRSFLTMLNGLAQGEPTDKLLSVDPSAYRAFFDLNMVFQYRFCQTICSFASNDWNILRQGQSESQFHPVQDILQITNPEQSKSLLETAVKTDPYNFGLHCALGLIELEMNQSEKALLLWEHALFLADTAPQKTLIHLLCSRVHELHETEFLAEQELNRALTIIPGCPEVLYRQILRMFHQGLSQPGITRLIALIENYPEFFYIALLDPELSAFDAVIQHELRNLSKPAIRAFKQKMQELSQQPMLYARIFEDTQEAQALADFTIQIAKIQQQNHQENYYNSIICYRAANQLMAQWQSLLEERKQSALKQLNLFIDQCERKQAFLAGLPYSSKIQLQIDELQRLYQDLVNARYMLLTEAPKCFSAASGIADQYQLSYANIEQSIKTLILNSRFRRFVVNILKNYLVIQVATFFIAMLLFPVIVHFILSTFPDLDIPPNLISFYTKIVLLSGLIAGLGISVVIALIRFYPDER